MTASAPQPPTYADLDVVVSLVDLPADPWDQAVKEGDMGTVVFIAQTPSLGYMVEFCDAEGATRATPFMQPEQIAPWVPPAKKAA